MTSYGHPSRVINAIPLSLSMWTIESVSLLETIWSCPVSPPLSPLTNTPGSSKNNSIFTPFFSSNVVHGEWVYVCVCVHCVPYKKGLPFYSNFVCTFLEKKVQGKTKQKKKRGKNSPTKENESSTIFQPGSWAAHTGGGIELSIFFSSAHTTGWKLLVNVSRCVYLVE